MAGPPLASAADGLVVPSLLLALWQVIVNLGVYSRSQLPAPLDVVAALRELADIGLLWPNVSPAWSGSRSASSSAAWSRPLVGLVVWPLAPG
jgi:hypothetical protein